jgi:hypothetical protein
MFSRAARSLHYSVQLRPILTERLVGAQIHRPRKALRFFSMESRAMSDKLIINLFGLTISADGIYAIVAAVIIIVLVLARRQPR